MGEAESSSTNGANHTSASSTDSSTLANPVDEPPIGGTPDAAIEKPICPHTLSAQRVAEILKTHSDHGLSYDEAAARLIRDGPNSIKGARGVSVWKIFVSQIANALTVVLCAVAALSFAIQDYVEAGVVVAVIVLNVVVG